MMEDKIIIDLWKRGLTVQQVAREYMTKYNKKLKSDEKKINKLQAQRHVEPIIFKYQASVMEA